MAATPQTPRKYEKYCVHGTCKNKSSKCAALGITFIPFPKPTTVQGAQRAQRWIAACKRESITLTSINTNTYVCSEHFTNPSGPYTDPIPATCEIVPCRRNAKREVLDGQKLSHPQVKVKKVVVGENTRCVATQTELCVTERSDGEGGTANSRSTTTSRLNLCEAIMTNFSQWVMKCDIASETFTASIMRLENFQVKLTVVAKFCNIDQYSLSIFIGQYKLQDKHALWEKHSMSTNLAGLTTVLHDLSNWNICVKIANTAQGVCSATTDCKLLCEVPRVLCPQCIESAKVSEAAKGKVSSKAVTPKSLMAMKHSNMNERMLRAKLTIMKRAAWNVKKQNKRLKAKVSKCIMEKKHLIRQYHYFIREAVESNWVLPESTP